MRWRLLLLVAALVAVSVVGYVKLVDRRDSRQSAGVDLAQAEVVVIGDSVTDQSSDQIVEAMPGRKVSVIGLSGLRTDQLLPVVEDVLGGADKPAVAVFMAGYNDLWQVAERNAPLEELMQLMAGVECAVWVVVPSTGPWDVYRAEAFDRRVRDAADDAGVAVASKWQEAVDAGDESGSPLVSSDLVHPSEAGKQAVADIMAEAVDDICG